MLIKQADDQSSMLEALERQAAGSGAAAKQAAEQLRIRKAGIKGERDSAYLIDFDFGAAPNWSVIHDLRLEHNGRVAQIDHLLINRWMDVYVLESKHFHAGVKITDEGEFLQWNAFKKTYQGMASPIEQNERHIQVLRELMSTIELPTRLGLRIAPSFHSLILVSSKARVDRSRQFDASRVIKVDHLKKAIWRDIDNESSLLALFKTATKIVSRETVEHVARQLAGRHTPGPNARTIASLPAAPATQAQVPASPQRPRERIEPTAAQLATVAPAQASATGPCCKSCEGRKGAILYGK